MIEEVYMVTCFVTFITVAIMKQVHAQQIHWRGRVVDRVGEGPLSVGAVRALCDELSSANADFDSLCPVCTSDVDMVV